MKKTKKALLAAVACVSVLTCAAAIAACNRGEGGGHTHNWGAWTVADENKPTAEAGGKATRTCSNDGCDAAEEDKEYTLPALTSNDYVKGDDSATCVTGGEITYTYNKNGVNVNFAVETPANPDAHGWSAWTVADENKPTAEAGGKATRTCSNDGCTAAAEDKEYTLPELNETDYTVNVTKEATCTETGTTVYTYNKNGVNVTFTVTTEAPDAHTLEKQDGLAATCELNGREEYYSCGECGKQFRDKDGREEFADLKEISIPAKHELAAVAASSSVKSVKRPNDAAANVPVIAHYKCDVCGKTFKDAEGQNEITSVYALSRYGMLLNFGANSVDATDVPNAKNGANYTATYIADVDGAYTFTLSEGVSVVQLIYVLTGTTSNSIAYSAVTSSSITTAGWQTEAASFERFTVPDAAQAPGNSVTVNMKKGEWLTFVVGSVKFTVDVKVKTAPVLAVGDNFVSITEAYSQFADIYEFVPGETKKYSMTVPEGVEVLMNDNDFIVGEDRTVNFDATEGEKILFAFKNTKVGAVTVKIGEAVELPKLTCEEKLASFNLVGHDVSVLEIGDVEEGRYTVTVNVANILMRTFVYFGKNISENYDDYFADNGNTVAGNPAEVSFQFPTVTVLNDAPYQATMSGATWTVTLDLKQGDKLVFVHGGTTGTAEISMAKA